jgi:predicted phage terminase large subunit-like protein
MPSFLDFIPTEKQAKFMADTSKYKLYGGSMGCLNGDTLLRINRGGCSRQYKIKDLFKKLNITKTLDSSIDSHTRCFQNDIIKLNLIKDVYYSGIKKTYTLKLTNGYSITATKDHKILTKNGWKALGNLNYSDQVMIDNISRHKKKAVNVKKYKKIYKRIGVGKYCSYAVKWATKERTAYTAELHRVIYDAFQNNMSLGDFIEQTKTNENLIYTNSKTHDIHHIDNNRFNNEISNLLRLEKKEHQRLHGNYLAFGHGKPEYSKVKSIRFCKEEDTYDISMLDPYNNFVANNIVVHNSGKSVVLCACAIQLSLLYPRNRGYLCRHEYTSFKKTTYEELKELLYGTNLIAKENKTEGELLFKNGSTIIMGGLENPDKLKSLNLGWFGIDEATETTLNIFQMLATRLRHKAVPNNRYFGLLATNPEPGWVKDEFVDPFMLKKQKHNYSFIQALPTDNPHLPEGYIDELRTMLKPLQVTKYLEGSWDVFEAQIFPHDFIMKSDPLPKDYQAIFMAVDPAITETDDEHLDETAICVMGIDNNDIIHEIETRHGRWSFQTTINNCKELYTFYQPNMFGVEKVAYQAALIQKLNDEQIPALPLTADRDKTRRAYSIQYMFENGRVRINNNKLIKQMLEFPEAARHGGHEDLVDAMVYNLIMIKNTSSHAKTPKIDKLKNLKNYERDIHIEHRERLNKNKTKTMVDFIYD